MSDFFGPARPREDWKRFAVVFIITFAVYNLAFLHLALPAYEHHDSYATLGIRAHCSQFDWYDLWTGRPLYAYGLCWATLLGEGIALAKAFRISACLSTAVSAGLFAAFLVRYVTRPVAVLFSLMAFSLPGVLFSVTMFQATLFTFFFPLLMLAGAASMLLYRTKLPRWQFALISATQFVVILAALELYQAIVPLVFLPLLTMLFFDRESPDKRSLFSTGHTIILFGLACICYLIGAKIIHVFVVFPAQIPIDSRNVDVAIGIGRLLDAAHWMWVHQKSHLARMWFTSEPGILFYSTPAIMLLILAAISLRVVSAWRAAEAAGKQPRAAAVMILFSIMLVLAAGNFIGFLVNAPDRSLLAFERVKWPVQILLLVPVFYALDRAIEWSRARPRTMTIAMGTTVALVILVIATVQNLVVQGRVAVGISERLFVRDQIARQIALGKSPEIIVVVGLASSPFPNPVNDEFFVMTAQNPASTVGMLLVFARELGIAPTLDYANENDGEGRDAMLERARSSNGIVVDFRQYPRVF